MSHKLCEIDGCYKDGNVKCIYIDSEDTSHPTINYLCKEHAEKLGYCSKCGNFGLKDCCKGLTC